jgi:hypothetical protein
MDAPSTFPEGVELGEGLGDAAVEGGALAGGRSAAAGPSQADMSMTTTVVTPNTQERPITPTER